MKKVSILGYKQKYFPFVYGLYLKGYDLNIYSNRSTGLIGKQFGYAVNKTKEFPLVKDIQKAKYSNESSVYLFDLNDLEENINRLIKEYERKDVSVFRVKEDCILTSQSKRLDAKESEGFKFDISKNFVDIDIPIILVGGVLEFVDNAVLSISMKLQLESCGYKVLAFSDDINCKLSGFISLSDLDDAHCTDFDLKIQTFNQAIAYYCKKNKTDIIIIELSKGIIRYNNKYLKSFGSDMFAFNEILDIDYFVCTFPCNTINLNYWKMVSNYLTKRYNLKINAIHISNQLINTQSKRNYLKDDSLFSNFNLLNVEEMSAFKEQEFLIGDIYEREFIKIIIDDFLGLVNDRK